MGTAENLRWLMAPGLLLLSNPYAAVCAIRHPAVLQSWARTSVALGTDKCSLGHLCSLEHPPVRQDAPVARLAGCQQQRGHGGRLAHLRRMKTGHTFRTHVCRAAWHEQQQGPMMAAWPVERSPLPWSDMASSCMASALHGVARQ